MSEHGSPRHQRAQARRDPTEWHGQRIITETDLGAVFQEDDADRRRRVSRRRILHGFVLVLLVGLVTAAVYVAVGIARGDISTGAPEAAPEPTSTCPAGPFDYQDPSAITVNVYNSTSIDGLAGTAAEQLRGRAFAVREIANRPVGPTGMTAIIVSGEAGRANAFTLQRTIPESIYVADEREDRTVDVILGSGYAGVVPPERMDVTPAGLSCAPEEASTPTPAPAAP
ncbi:LytR C-terminal domain-containing protein [Arthrobacter sp. L77]|uniref:LytR C-terminal domain-containing protein n=1 Tax=Arthrobacter sp. L77 TaxID=1496689 RepID=UPI000690B95B|nr:LytR C-terminal domain-containing protein [Arthrobacter sp. L77]